MNISILCIFEPSTTKLQHVSAHQIQMLELLVLHVLAWPDIEQSINSVAYTYIHVVPTDARINRMQSFSPG